MPRFQSLKQAPSETRRVLRSRLPRNLPSQNWANSSPDVPRVSDEAVLALLLQTEIRFGNDSETCRLIYEQARAGRVGAPAFDDLPTTGLFRIAWGRVYSAIRDAKTVQGAPPILQECLSGILAQRFDRRFVVDACAASNAELASTIATMSERPEGVHRIHCPDPAWVAARLWERAPIRDPHARLRFCVDRWEMLERHSFVPSQVWDGPTTTEYQ